MCKFLMQFPEAHLQLANVLSQGLVFPAQFFHFASKRRQLALAIFIHVLLRHTRPRGPTTGSHAVTAMMTTRRSC